MKCIFSFIETFPYFLVSIFINIFNQTSPLHMVGGIHPMSIIILAIPNANLYQNFYPCTGLFLDTHVITEFLADTTTYEKPTIFTKLNIEPRTKPLVLYILCIYHKDTHLGVLNQMLLLIISANRLLEHK